MIRVCHVCSLIVMVCLFATGCTTIVGDACDIDSDCGTGLLCDASMPDGYCTRPDCDDEGCPDSGLCVTFDLDTAYCMKPCNGADDCRPEYRCVTDFGPYSFCAVATGDL